ncbi:MAG: hypothetical protein ABSF77_21235, partial [Spirochaetia bacterium]
MSSMIDGPSSPLFIPIPIGAAATAAELELTDISDQLRAALAHAPRGECVCRGIPFDVDAIAAVHDAPVTVPLPNLKARWLVFLHTSDVRPMEANEHGVYSPMRGEGQLGELACTYHAGFADGTDAALPVRRRFQIGCFTRRWGENCFEAVAHAKSRPVHASHEQLRQGWGWTQTRVESADFSELMLWLYAWENPKPDIPLSSLRCEPGAGTVLLFGIAAGSVTSHPLRWETRRKAILTLPEGAAFTPDLDENGLLKHVRLDLGQVISALPRPLYPDQEWESGYNNAVPELSKDQVLIEYTAHPQACFHFSNGETIAAAALGAPAADALRAPVTDAQAEARPSSVLQPVATATKRIRLTVVEKGSAAPVPVKLHVHGQAGEYLAPLDRHRIPNPAWFEDYSVDFVHAGSHWCTYINGETMLDLPIGTAFVEIAKGFEVRPVRRRLDITKATDR